MCMWSWTYHGWNEGMNHIHQQSAWLFVFPEVWCSAGPSYHRNVGKDCKCGSNAAANHPGFQCFCQGQTHQMSLAEIWEITSSNYTLHAAALQNPLDVQRQKCNGIEVILEDYMLHNKYRHQTSGGFFVSYLIWWGYWSVRFQIQLTSPMFLICISTSELARVKYRHTPVNGSVLPSVINNCSIVLPLVWPGMILPVSASKQIKCMCIKRYRHHSWLCKKKHQNKLVDKKIKMTCLHKTVALSNSWNIQVVYLYYLHSNPLVSISGKPLIKPCSCIAWQSFLLCICVCVCVCPYTK